MPACFSQSTFQDKKNTDRDGHQTRDQHFTIELTTRVSLEGEGTKHQPI